MAVSRVHPQEKVGARLEWHNRMLQLPLVRRQMGYLGYYDGVAEVHFK